MYIAELWGWVMQCVNKCKEAQGHYASQIKEENKETSNKKSSEESTEQRTGKRTGRQNTQKKESQGLTRVVNMEQEVSFD